MIFRKIALFIFFTGYSHAFAQSDSLYTIFVNTKLPDSVRMDAINDLAWQTIFTDPAKAQKYANMQLTLARKMKSKRSEAHAYNTLGASNQLQGNYDKSIIYHKKALALRLAIKDKDGISSSYSNLGSAYEGLSDFAQSLGYYLKSLKIEEELNTPEGLAQSYINIGLIYESIATESFNRSDYDRALKYYFKSYNITKKTKFYHLQGAALGNIGNVYFAFKEYDKALSYQKQSLVRWRKANQYQGLTSTYGNIGNAYLHLPDSSLKNYNLSKADRFKIADIYFDSCYSLASQMGDKKGMALCFDSKGFINYQRGDYAKSIELHLQGLKIFNEIGDIDDEKHSHQSLYEGYKIINQPAKALKHFELYTILKDSIYKIENQQEITRKELSFEYKKRSSIDSLKRAEERTIVKARLRHEELTRYYLYGGLAVVLLFSIFIFNRFRITKKQKVIIEGQKIIVEEKNKEITDSINYAKRLQDAILPPDHLWRKALPNSFNLYKPKDIVAGDFYWMEVVSDNNILFAAADCTGHGVPGALVSVVCSNALNRAVKEFNLKQPAQILDKVRELVIETFRANNEISGNNNSEVKDGMDISLCSLNLQTLKLEWAGANNPLWIYENATKAIREIDPDHQPIGFHHTPKPFNSQNIQLQKDDVIFVFTDGFADQFGGPKGKKFKYSSLQKLLIQCQEKGFASTMKTLENTFTEWKNDLEQLDDVCIIGVKV